MGCTNLNPGYQSIYSRPPRVDILYLGNCTPLNDQGDGCKTYGEPHLHLDGAEALGQAEAAAQLAAERGRLGDAEAAALSHRRGRAAGCRRQQRVRLVPDRQRQLPIRQRQLPIRQRRVRVGVPCAAAHVRHRPVLVHRRVGRVGRGRVAAIAVRERGAGALGGHGRVRGRAAVWVQAVLVGGQAKRRLRARQRAPQRARGDHSWRCSG